MLLPRKEILLAVGLLALYALGVGVRMSVLEKQYEIVGRDLPFTMESALQFRMVEQVALVGGLPETDKMVQYPEGLPVAKSYTVGAEYFYGLASKLLPSFLSLAEKARWLECLWFCLAIPLIAVWVGVWRRSIWGGAVAGLFYAVALSSVIRSTGQELSRENFALPLLLGHFAMNALAVSRNQIGKGHAPMWISAVLLGLAMCAWDLVQFYVGLWMLASAVIALRGGYSLTWRRSWTAHWLVLLACGLLNPYLRFHGFVFSPLMCLGYGIAAILFAIDHRDKSHGFRFRVGVLLLPVGIALLLPTAYGSSYSHFFELLLGKLRFLNQKPTDPSLLTFGQKIMWVPALHSASWPLTWTFMPAILPLTLMAVCVAVRDLKHHHQSGLAQLTVFCVTSLIAFTLFVRFHIFFAVSASALLGWLATWPRAKGLFVRMIVPALLIIGFTCEAMHVVRQPEKWGRLEVYYDELDELVEWLDTHVAPEPVLANFGVSGSILAYGRCPVVLHPKFENEEIRHRVREYGEELFKGTEASFREWADQYGTRYYVYALGEFAERGPQEQMRYFVDALEPPEDAPARLFEYRPQEGRYFRYQWGNRKYRVFRMLTRTEEELADRLANEADEFFEQGDLVNAEERVTAALRLDPVHEESVGILKHILSLRERGFEYRGHGDDEE